MRTTSPTSRDFRSPSAAASSPSREAAEASARALTQPRILQARLGIVERRPMNALEERGEPATLERMDRALDYLAKHPTCEACRARPSAHVRARRALCPHCAAGHRAAPRATPPPRRRVAAPIDPGVEAGLLELEELCNQLEDLELRAELLELNQLAREV